MRKLVTITADALDAARGGVLVVDGVTSEIAAYENAPGGIRTGYPSPQPPSDLVKLTEPCETCDGTGNKYHRQTMHMDVIEFAVCPDCDGSGRPLLEVEAEPSDPENWTENWRHSFRAHVLDVVPIYHNDSTPMLGGRTLIEVFDDADPVLWRNGHPEPITLPPGDHRGRYAVLIEPENHGEITKENR